MKSVTKNSIFYIIYSTLNVLFPLITGIYVSHVLFESYIGEVEAARNIAQYFVILSYLGIPTYGLREIAKARNNKEELNKVFSELAIINFISTSVFLLIYIGVVFSVPVYRNDLPLYLISGLSIALNFLNISWLYEGLEEFSFVCLRNLIFKILCFVLLVLLVKDNSDYLVYAAITIIGIGGNYILNVFRARKHVRLTFKGLNLKRHLKSIFFLVVVNLAIEIYTLVDITMLKFLSTNENIAYYSYGSKIYKIFIHLLNSFTMVVVPRLSYLIKNNKRKDYNELLGKTLTVIVLLAIPMIVGVYFTADFLIIKIYGDSYIKSAQVLKILSIIFIISPVGYLLGSRVLLATGHENKMIYPVLIGAAINIILNYLLIMKFQEIGAAIASVVSEFVVAFVYILLSRKEIQIKISYKNYSKIFLSAFIMVLMLVLLKYSKGDSASLITIKQIIFGVVYYFGILYASKEVTTRHYAKAIHLKAKKLLRI